jgi:hypothetical protein
MAITTVFDDQTAAASVTGPAAVAGETTDPTHGEIAALAYAYWEARGGRAGSPWEDWFRAERELRSAPRGTHRSTPEQR